MVNPNFSFWFGVWTSIIGLAAAGSVSFTGIIPADYVPVVKTWAVDLVAINNVILTALHGVSSNQAGPLVK